MKIVTEGEHQSFCMEKLLWNVKSNIIESIGEKKCRVVIRGYNRESEIYEVK